MDGLLYESAASGTSAEPGLRSRFPILCSNPIGLHPNTLSTNMTWRTSPFVVGQRYRVKQSFASAFSHFAADETLIYQEEQYSSYDSSSVYVFRNESTNETREWWLHDEQPLESWLEHFQPL